MKTPPVYVERSVNGKVEDLKLLDWNWKVWSGCFCLIADKQLWSK